MNIKIYKILEEYDENIDENLLLKYLFLNNELFKKGILLPIGDIDKFYNKLEYIYLKIEGKYFLGGKFNKLNSIYQDFIKINIGYKLKLKKRGLRNFFNFFTKNDPFLLGLKALDKFKLVDNPEIDLLNRKEEILEYLYVSFSLDKNDKIINYLKEYFDRLFSLKKYVSYNSRNELINNYFIKNSNYLFFIKNDDFKYFINHNLGLKALIEDKRLVVGIKEDIDFNKEKVLVEYEKTKKEIINLKLKNKEQEEKIISLKVQLENKEEENIKQENVKSSRKRVDYNIGLIFGDKRSVKGFKRELKEKSGILKYFNLTSDNFKILAEERGDQQKLNINSIKNSLIGISNTINFIICFETDHHTLFHDTIRKDFPEQITILNKSKQHFSKASFENILKEALEKYERSENNNIL